MIRLRSCGALSFLYSLLHSGHWKVPLDRRTLISPLKQGRCPHGILKMTLKKVATVHDYIICYAKVK
jgi:hypothetical protein